MYIHLSLLWKFSDQIQNCYIQFNKVKDWTLTFQNIGQNFKSCLESTTMIGANSWKNRRKIIQQSQRNHVYDASKPEKFFLKLFQNLRYFSACVILVECFVHFMLHKRYWILLTILLILQVWLYNWYVIAKTFRTQV